MGILSTELITWSLVGGVVLYMILMQSPLIGEYILEKRFGTGIRKYYPEITFAHVLIALLLFSLLSNVPLSSSEAHRIYGSTLVALVCAVIHKVVIIRELKAAP